MIVVAVLYVVTGSFGVEAALILTSRLGNHPAPHRWRATTPRRQPNCNHNDVYLDTHDARSINDAHSFRTSVRLWRTRWGTHRHPACNEGQTATWKGAWLLGFATRSLTTTTTTTRQGLQHSLLHSDGALLTDTPLLG